MPTQTHHPPSQRELRRLQAATGDNGRQQIEILARLDAGAKVDPVELTLLIALERPSRLGIAVVHFGSSRHETGSSLKQVNHAEPGGVQVRPTQTREQSYGQ